MTFKHARVMPACLVAGTFLISAASASAASFVYTTLDAPGETYTYASGINDQDVVVGEAHDASNNFQGLVWSKGTFTLVAGAAEFGAVNNNGLAVGGNLTQGQYVTYNISSAALQVYNSNLLTQVTYAGINDAGKIAASNTQNFKVYTALLLSGNKAKRLKPAGAKTAQSSAINKAGTVVGYYTDQTHRQHGFTYQAGTITSFDAPGSSGTVPLAINDAGTIAGLCVSPTTGGFEGFTDSSGTFTFINPPGAGYSAIHGINKSGDLAGTMIDSASVEHGFIYRGGNYYQIDVPGSSSTYVSGINALGSLIGFYMVGTATTMHPFIAQCPTGQSCTQ